MSNKEHDLNMHSFGSDMKKGTLTKWMVKEGDHIKRGDVVAVIETHKGAIDSDLFEDALIVSLLAKEGDQISVGEPIARLRSIKDSENAAPHTANKAYEDLNPLPSPSASAAEQANGNLTAPKGFIVATPAPRSFARQHQLGLNFLFPNQMQKIVTLPMIEQAIKQKTISAQSPSPAENVEPTDKKEPPDKTLSSKAKTATTTPKKGFDKEAMRQAISATDTTLLSKPAFEHYSLRGLLSAAQLLQNPQARWTVQNSPSAVPGKALELDSMDFLNLVIAVSKRTQVAIPEADYAKVLTLNTMISYVMSHA